MAFVVAVQTLVEKIQVELVAADITGMEAMIMGRVEAARVAAEPTLMVSLAMEKITQMGHAHKARVPVVV